MVPRRIFGLNRQEVGGEEKEIYIMPSFIISSLHQILAY
jgi:hypothetical protein